MGQLELFEYDQLEQNDRDFIQDRTLEIKSLVKRSAQDIIEIGLKLIEVKKRLPHGMWRQWLDREFGWTQMTAFRFMNVAIKFNKLLNLENFGQSALYLLASPSTPDEAINEAIDRANQGKTITHKMAKEIVMDHKGTEEPSPEPPPIVSPVASCPECGNLYDIGVFTNGCPYCYKEKNDLSGWIEGLPDKMKNEIETSQAAKLITSDSKEEPKDNVHFSSETPEWYTPQHIIDRVIETFEGTIDLDPCSNSADNPNVPAINHFTKQDDGLSQFWSGRVYMNSPYGNELALWVNKALEEYQSNRISEVIVLAPARTDTKWFQSLRQFPKCFITGRLKFVGGNNSAPFPSMLVYLGPNNEKFFTSFSDIGDIYELKRFGYIEK